MACGSESACSSAMCVRRLGERNSAAAVSVYGRVVGAGIACCAEGAGSATISLEDGYTRVSSMTILSLSALSGMRHGELFRVGTFYVGFNPSCDQRGSGIPSVSNAASCSLAPVRPSTCSRVARRAHGNRKRQWME